MGNSLSLKTSLLPHLPLSKPYKFLNPISQSLILLSFKPKSKVGKARGGLGALIVGVLEARVWILEARA